MSVDVDVRSHQQEGPGGALDRMCRTRSAGLGTLCLSSTPLAPKQHARSEYRLRYKGQQSQVIKHTVVFQGISKNSLRLSF